MFFRIAGAVLIVAGLVISILFWIPRVVDRGVLRQVLGRRYPVVYLIYTANGPGLVALGVLVALKG